MEIGMIGLGKMGTNMATRLVEGGHDVYGFDLDQENFNNAINNGVTGMGSLEELVSQLKTPRCVWLMLPAGVPTSDTMRKLETLLAADDVIIDGGNAYYKDSMARAEHLAAKGIHFLDTGVSGGVWGRSEGYGLMIGGSAEIVARLQPLFETLAPAPDHGWIHAGPTGAGHFVKMVHNGIEYGMMQAYAEGFAILKTKQEFKLDLYQIAEGWRYGTVVRSWLLDLTARALAEDQDFEEIAAWVDDSGEGRWTVEESIDLAVPAPVISEALYARFRSRHPTNFADRLLAALRNQFGGHAVKKQ